MILAALLSQTVLSLYPYKKLQSTIFTTEKGQKIKQHYDSLRLGATGGPIELFFDAPVDNYNNQGNDTATYKMRYIMDDTYFDPVDGVILFYAGNEGDVWTFYNASGFMTTTLAAELKALVVVGEHRYFGTS
jgi:pimeloyl-ACP methyl ester carboxylesterase